MGPTMGHQVFCFSASAVREEMGLNRKWDEDGSVPGTRIEEKRSDEVMR